MFLQTSSRHILLRNATTLMVRMMNCRTKEWMRKYERRNFLWASHRGI